MNGPDGGFPTDVDLAEAERWARRMVASEFQPPGPGLDALRLLLAEYDRRGQEIERLTAERHADAYDMATLEAERDDARVRVRDLEAELVAVRAQVDRERRTAEQIKAHLVTEQARLRSKIADLRAELDPVRSQAILDEPAERESQRVAYEARQEKWERAALASFIETYGVPPERPIKYPEWLLESGSLLPTQAAAGGQTGDLDGVAGDERGHGHHCLTAAPQLDGDDPEPLAMVAHHLRPHHPLGHVADLDTAAPRAGTAPAVVEQLVDVDEHPFRRVAPAQSQVTRVSPVRRDPIEHAFEDSDLGQSGGA